MPDLDEISLEEFLVAVIAVLRETGVKVDRGLDDRELARAEAAVGCTFPPDLALFLRLGLPVRDKWSRQQQSQRVASWRRRRGRRSNPVSGSGLLRWPSWRDDPEGTADRARARVQDVVLSAVAFGGYWIDDWGDRPRDAAAAKEAAAEAITSWPPLIQVFQHRFMPSFPVGAGNPVLSVWQANDTIYYGNDLADYLHREFGRPGLGLDQPSWSARYPRHVPYWSEAFDLLYDEMDVRCEVLPDEMRALHKDFVRRLAMIRRNHSSQQEAASDIDALSQSTKSRFDDIVETVTADVWDSVFLDRLSRSLNGDDKGNTARK